MKSQEPTGTGSKLKGLLVLLVVGVFFIAVAVGAFILLHRESIKRALERPPEETEPKQGEVVQYEYFCPMHPQVIQDTAGNCPICGMVLSRREKTKSTSDVAGAIIPEIRMVHLEP
jgi:hypothetical protein